MHDPSKIEVYFSRPGPFRQGLNLLRELARKTEAEETLKWGMPVYTFDNKNVFGLLTFKNHFGIWFFQGVFLKDPEKVLRASREDTRGLRQWKFASENEIEAGPVLSYMLEALENQRQGRVLKPLRPKETVLPPLLGDTLKKDPSLQAQFNSLSPYKQREYCEHIGDAKQEKTRLSRLEKSILLIREGLGLHDKYR